MSLCPISDQLWRQGPAVSLSWASGPPHVTDAGPPPHQADLPADFTFVPYHPPCTCSTWAHDMSPSMQDHRGTWYTHTRYTHTHTHARYTHTRYTHTHGTHTRYTHTHGTHTHGTHTHGTHTHTVHTHTRYTHTVHTHGTHTRTVHTHVHSSSASDSCLG